jgi:hypothetical protein
VPSLLIIKDNLTGIQMEFTAFLSRILGNGYQYILAHRLYIAIKQPLEQRIPVYKIRYNEKTISIYSLLYTKG